MCMGRKRVIEIDGEMVLRDDDGRCGGESDGFLMGDVGRRDGLTLFLESAYPFWVEQVPSRDRSGPRRLARRHRVHEM